jgi:hypothetical protein
MARKPTFWRPSLSPSSGNWLPPKSAYVMIYLDKRVGGRSKVPAVLGPAFTFITLSVVSGLAWPGLTSRKPSSLIKLLLFKPISIASFTRRSTYPDILCSSVVPLDSMQWLVLMLYFATADFSGWCILMCLWCSLNLVLIVLAVSYIHFSAFTG